MQQGKRIHSKKWIAILCRVIWSGLIEKVRFLSKTYKWVSSLWGYLEEESYRKREQLVVRPWGWSKPELFEKYQGVSVATAKRKRETSKRWSVMENFVLTWLCRILSRSLLNTVFLVCPWNTSIWISGFSKAYCPLQRACTSYWPLEFEWKQRQRKGEVTPFLPDSLS